MTDTNMVTDSLRRVDNDQAKSFVKKISVSVDYYAPTSLNTIGWSTNAVNGCFRHWIFDLLTNARSKSGQDAMIIKMIKQQRANYYKKE